MMRRPLDIVGACLGLALTWPLLICIGLATAETLGRPVLFRQVRSGRGGRPFVMVKFRTMRALHDPAGRLLPDKLRATRLGRLLRRTRLDELPELWNIARGDMSFVGPRPLLQETIAAMGEAGHVRGSVRPGLTGWAQVNGNALLSERDKLALDLWYVANASFATDLMIIARTLKVVFFGERINERRVKEAYASHRRRGG
jgi:lipopolysaccharide/colanic/teichoic acid biosynthesis glycosyltransferase